MFQLVFSFWMMYQTLWVWISMQTRIFPNILLHSIVKGSSKWLLRWLWKNEQIKIYSNTLNSAIDSVFPGNLFKVQTTCLSAPSTTAVCSSLDNFDEILKYMYNIVYTVNITDLHLLKCVMTCFFCFCFEFRSVPLLL